MIKTIFADGKSEIEALAGLAGRGAAPGAGVEQDVRQIIESVRAEGDAAVVRFALRFDGPEAAPGGRIGTLSREDLKSAFESLDAPLADALIHAAENIREYHKKQADMLKGYELKREGDGAGVDRGDRGTYNLSTAGAAQGDGAERREGVGHENYAARKDSAAQRVGAAPGEGVGHENFTVRKDSVAQGAGAERENGSYILTGQIVRGLERVGVYVPGGTAAYPSTVLMNVIPAKLAGVEEIIMVTPPRCGGGDGGGRTEGTFATDAVGDGETAIADVPGDSGRTEGTFATDAAILAAAYIAGVDRVILAGGGQAVAALAFGTETIPRVDKIVGPGNIYVATAKRLLYGVVDIDMIAGPSEILIIADESANAAFAAADMLSQAEHDPNAAAVLLTTSPATAAAAASQLSTQIESLARRETAITALEKNGLIIVCRSEDEMVRLANEIAPEHLEILTADPMALLTRIKNAGSVFLGPWTPEPVGDYYSGTNHVLPTSGTARFASPLGVYDFVKRMSYTRYSEEALRNAKKDIAEISGSEGLTAHANAVKIRFEK